MTTINTKLTTPATVTRTVTDRVIFEIFSNGTLILWDATKENKIATVDLSQNPAQTVKYKLHGPKYCGAVVVQQSGWQIECRGESSHVLGSVDFPFIGGAPYKIYPQKDRACEFVVVFEKAGTGAAITTSVQTAEGAKTTQRCEIFKDTAFTVVFVGFTERSVVTEPGLQANTEQHRVISMPAGGVITLQPAMQNVGATIVLGELPE